MRFIRFLFAAVLAAQLLLSVQSAFAIDAITADPQNKRWHVAEKTMTATFLGGDKAESAIIILDKKAVAGMTLTIRSDGPFILMQSADSPHVGFDVSEKGEDGATSKIQLSAGDQPLVFNDKPQIKQEGHWIQIMANADKTIRLEITSTTFATIIFEPPSAPAPPVAAPKPAPPPPPDNELMHDVAARSLQNVTNTFSESVGKTCTLCKGTGKVNVKVQTGTDQQGPFLVPVFGTEERKCERCKGTGIERAADDTILNLSARMVKDLVEINPKDPKKPETLSSVYQTITDRMIGDQKTWKLLTAYGKSALAQGTPALGTSLVSRVEVMKAIKLDGDHRRYLVRVIGTDKQVYVDDPVLVDELMSGNALMGGLVGKPVAEKDGKTTLLHGGFLIAPAVDKDWYWVKDQD